MPARPLVPPRLLLLALLAFAFFLFLLSWSTPSSSSSAFSGFFGGAGDGPAGGRRRRLHDWHAEAGAALAGGLEGRIHYAVVTAGRRSNLVVLLHDLVHRCGVPKADISVFVDAPSVDLGLHDYDAADVDGPDGLLESGQLAPVQWAHWQGYTIVPRPAAHVARALHSGDKLASLALFYRFIWDTVFFGGGATGGRGGGGGGADTDAAADGPGQQHEYVAFLEDDLSLSPDLHAFFTALAPVFRVDKKLFAVSGHNDAGFPATSLDPRVVLRSEHFSQPGWMTSRAAFKRFVAPHLPSNLLDPDWPAGLGDIQLPEYSFAKDIDPDHWAYVRKHWDWRIALLVYKQQGGETLFPEVPRVYHGSWQCRRGEAVLGRQEQEGELDADANTLGGGGSSSSSSSSGAEGRGRPTPRRRQAGGDESRKGSSDADDADDDDGADDGWDFFSSCDDDNGGTNNRGNTAGAISVDETTQTRFYSSLDLYRGPPGVLFDGFTEERWRGRHSSDNNFGNDDDGDGIANGDASNDDNDQRGPEKRRRRRRRRRRLRHMHRRLTSGGYDAVLRDFIVDARTIMLMPECIQDLRSYRHTRVVVPVPAKADADPAWNRVLSENFDLEGVGQGAVPRGVWRGTVTVRYMTNRVLLVGMYSPHFDASMVYSTRCRGADPMETLARTVYITLAPPGKSCERACSEIGRPGALPAHHQQQHQQQQRWRQAKAAASQGTPAAVGGGGGGGGGRFACDAAALPWISRCDWLDQYKWLHAVVPAASGCVRAKGPAASHLALPAFVPGTGKIVVSRLRSLSCTRVVGSLSGGDNAYDGGGAGGRDDYGGGAAAAAATTMGQLICPCSRPEDRLPRQLEQGRRPGLAAFVDRHAMEQGEHGQGSRSRESAEAGDGGGGGGQGKDHYQKIYEDEDNVDEDSMLLGDGDDDDGNDDHNGDRGRDRDRGSAEAPPQGRQRQRDQRRQPHRGGRRRTFPTVGG